MRFGFRGVSVHYPAVNSKASGYWSGTTSFVQAAGHPTTFRPSR
jgi:hypothetical protein